LISNTTISTPTGQRVVFHNGDKLGLRNETKELRREVVLLSDSQKLVPVATEGIVEHIAQEFKRCVAMPNVEVPDDVSIGDSSFRSWP